MKLPKDYVPGVGVVKPTGGYGGFGQKMLEKMGWAEGQGLGKEKHGMKAAIEVQKKEDTLGVSASPSGVMFQCGCHAPCSSPQTQCAASHMLHMSDASLQYALFASRVHLSTLLSAPTPTHTP